MALVSWTMAGRPGTRLRRLVCMVYSSAEFTEARWYLTSEWTAQPRPPPAYWELLSRATCIAAGGAALWWIQGHGWRSSWVQMAGDACWRDAHDFTADVLFDIR